MPRRNEIKNGIGTALYSIQVYVTFYFDNFSPDKPFEKWAAKEVSDFDTVPEGMEIINIPDGLYAVFLHKGYVSDGPKTFEYIFRDGYTMHHIF